MSDAPKKETLDPTNPESVDRFKAALQKKMESNVSTPLEVVQKQKNSTQDGVDIDKNTYSVKAEGDQATFSVPHEIVQLPSKGLLYPTESELAKGYIAMKYMTGREEDILTNQSLIQKGVVLDELFKSMILTPIRYSDLLIGDKNAIIMYARILSYGPTYEVEVTSPSGKTFNHSINLSEMEYKWIDESKCTLGRNEFTFVTPKSGDTIKFRLLTVKDEWDVEKEIKRMQKIGKQTNVTSRLKKMFISVNGEESYSYIHDYVNNRLLAIDSMAFRDYVKEIQPGIDMSIEVYDEDTGEPFRTEFTPGLDFFWPSANRQI